MRNLPLYCVLFLVFLPVLTMSGALNDDVLGLIVLKADLEDPTSKLASWNEDDDDPCGWVGVTCSPRTNRVTELNLDGFSLSGKIGRGLLQLQSLRKLSLSKNNFSGSLNPNLSQLESLSSVDLSENNLSGSIPDEFFRQCRSLSSISLANNAFSGEIPPSVGSCSTLAELNLSSNRLSGRLPSGLWSLYGLRSLDLSGNSLSGDIPMGISRLYNLRAISLRGNRLSGGLPDDIGGCLLLKSLDLSENLLTGKLPETMRKLSLCSYLSLGSNSFSGEVLTWVGEMKGLETLNLSSNGFSGQVPDSIGNLQLVKRLDFSQNNFTGSLPQSIGICKSLLEVDFSQNSLTGDLPTWIFELGLQSISMSGNKMSGSIQIPVTTDQTLKTLDLSSNGFSGGIPVDIGNIHGLQFLNLSWNSLSGSMPASLGELKSLQVLDLSGNRLNGSIPPEIGEAVSLNELNLHKNSLTGGIPTQIGNCSSLASLILSQNNLTGPVPSTFSNITNLQTIDLSHNRLTGTLPKQLSNLPHLLSFNISHNLFSGDLPAGNFFNTIPRSSISDNPGLCGSVVNRSCRAVLPKPIVLNPNSSSPNPSSNSAFSPGSLRHKKIILSISTLIAIGAAALIALGVFTITVLNLRVRAAAASQSAAALAFSDDYCSRSPGTEADSGKLVMFSGNDPDFSAGAHAILNKDCELGRGGFGAVYKTILRDGRPVAIKKLTVSSLVKSQEDFEREVKKLGKVRHPNLVALEGYYWTPSLQLLIHEFVSGGNLYGNLHESSASNSLSWQERFDIILGIARGLAHLHRLNIIHYNLKSSNILIDGSGEAKVGDYGLANLLPKLDRYVLSSKIQSALGYMAPEFACRTVKITEKCDVYGFGVLVLEILTGRRPVEYMEDDVVVLCDVVRGALEEGRVEECVDGRLGGKFPVEEAVPVLKLGLICTSQVPSNRPDMAEAVNILRLIRCPQDGPEEELS
ncbi:probable LRR receptor-like serine/threonine-protein kinase IRK [Phoenix dactylifera]|uniref:Probable LRR receptor-like serine/threonine-protein kinase IRK n=1 Tax=Phoenix dactylifera TaxID=42345 RepID=A0A8B7BZH0_PHODC|nr:probable LRR receptor-like serine/threonine-protein kinase IRK [Phoenix dactylifera]